VHVQQRHPVEPQIRVRLEQLVRRRLQRARVRGGRVQHAALLRDALRHRELAGVDKERPQAQQLLAGAVEEAEDLLGPGVCGCGCGGVGVCGWGWG